MKKFCESLREHAMKIINFKEKKMEFLTKEQLESHENAKICYICKEKFENKYLKDKKYCKVRDHYHYTGEYRVAVHIMCNLKYTEPKKIPIVFYNGSNDDYPFVIKELVEEFEKQFTSFKENTDKYITFTVPIEKEVTRIDKNGEEICKYISYILQFIDSPKFMASSLLNLSIILLKEFIELNVNTDMMVKNVKLVKGNISIATVFLNTQILKII